MKTILCIKKVVWMLCALFVVSACSYDDEEIWNKVNEHEERISALEDWQKQVNSNITALQGNRLYHRVCQIRPDYALSWKERRERRCGQYTGH